MITRPADKHSPNPITAMLKLKRCFNGFQIHGRLHQFTSLILYSTSSVAKEGIPIPNPLMVKLLVQSVGFSHDEAISIATDSKVSHRFKSTTKSQLVVDFFKSVGLDESHIRKVVTFSPQVLRCKVEKTLEPKIRFFQELGFSGPDLGLVLSKHPDMLNRSLNKNIVPVLSMLISLIGCSNDQLVSFLLKTNSQGLQSPGLLRYLPHNLLLLQSYDVPREKFKWLMLRQPSILSRRTRWVERILKGVEEKLGIPRTSGMFLHGVVALSDKSDVNVEKWRQVFRCYGWSETEICELLRRQPAALSLSEELVSHKLKYFMEDLGYGSDYLATHPVLMTYSLEKRIVPRIAVIQALKDNQLLRRNVVISTIMSKAESQFVDKYVLPFKDKLPQLFEYYTQTAGRSLSKHSLP